eukprot:Hpha_TRINITY_DN6127_c0_g1::TRINITY_DN6127_c0_g1_i1::g.164888::m.164888
MERAAFAAGTGFVGYATEWLSANLDLPVKLVIPDAGTYLGRWAFLTHETNVLSTVYFGWCVYETGFREVPNGESTVQRALFPLAFGLGSFLTTAYYALDHFNPVSVERRAHWRVHGYPYCGLAAHLEHCVALPIVVLYALTWAGPRPSWEDGWRPLLGFMVYYVVLIHLNKCATGQWVYPILDDVTKAAGWVGRSAFFMFLVGATMGLARAGVWLAGG